MPKIAKEMSALEVRRLTKPGRYAVGGVRGLLLHVGPPGGRSWVIRMTIGAKRREAGLGPFPEVGLAEAREMAKEFRAAVRDGRDPVAEKEAARQALIEEQQRSITFEEAARACHRSKQAEFRSRKHAKDWISALERHAFPTIGARPVARIELADVLQVLEPIWNSKTETATRVRQRIEAVLAWSAVSGFRSGDNPARWSENLDQVLPKPSKLKKVRHHRALPWQEVGQFVLDLRKRDGAAAQALEFAILTAARSGEVRGMEWQELDLEARVWTVPGDRIKAGKPHRVPLSDRALEILKATPHREGLVFRGARGGALSDMSLSAVCKRMKVDATPHGFRSSFKDWARNATRYPDEASELALAHVNSDATRAAYARDELLPIRARLMADWSRFCETRQAAGDVVNLERKGSSHGQ
jgi:integrase